MLGDRGAPPRDNPVLDGVGAGIFGALTRLVIADIMRGTGRYNLAQGAVGRGFKPPRACILSRTWRSQAIPALWSAWANHNLRDVNRRFFGSI